MVLSSIVNFPTRIQKNSQTIIDNIFINTLKFNNFSVYPFVNGLSDHDAQRLIIYDIITDKTYTILLSVVTKLTASVVRVSGNRYRGLGFDSRRYQIF